MSELPLCGDLAMVDDDIVRRRRCLPHWLLTGSMYFVTFRLQAGVLTDDERDLVMEHLKSGTQRFYDLAAAVIMPDHAHILIKPRTPYDLSRVMKGIKGVSARKINEIRQTTGPLWQPESWDRIMRDDVEFLQKLQYMADNPVKSGLARRIEDYRSWYCDPELF